MRLDAPRDLHVRPARRDEADTLTGIALAAKASWGYAPELMARWRDELTLRPGDIDRMDVIVAADERDAPAGFAALRVNGVTATLEHLWILPGRMGNGVGRTLLGLALAQARSRGARRIVLDADPHARGFYEHLGFRRVADRPAPIPGDPARVLPVLELPLAD
jgi:GNAT superfamily N-acetyltransferase